MKTISRTNEVSKISASLQMANGRSMLTLVYHGDENVGVYVTYIDVADMGPDRLIITQDEL